MPPQEKRYFVPEQLVFCLKHGVNVAQSIIDNVIVNAIEAIDGISLPVSSFAGQTRTFRDGDTALSYVFVTVSGMDNSTRLTRHKGVQQAISRVNSVLSGTAQYTTSQQTAAMSLETIFLEEEIQLVSVLPNWHGGNAQAHGIPVGGPGAKPVIPTGDPATSWDYSYFVEQAGVNPAADALKSLMDASSGGANLKIAVLDTLPRQICDGNTSTNDPREGSAALVTALPTLTNNPLMDSLRTSGKLTLKSYKEIAQSASVWQSFWDTQPGTPNKDVANYDHDYVMADHGLFSTGIIHAVAPDADLELIQMLNDYGVGTLESMIDALLHVHNTYCIDENGDPIGDTVLVNCSFVLTVSDDESIDVRNGFAKVCPPHPIDSDFSSMAQSLRSLAPGAKNALNPLFSLLRRYGVLIVAAAGNEGETPQGRTPARLPAALAPVVGVGALVKMGASGYTTIDYTSYTNLADEPLSDGFLVFGGNAVSNPLEADPADGMLGLYLGDFPGSSLNGESDSNGWARWAGTSFATPIVTGMLALLIGSGQSVPVALTNLRDAKSESVSGDHSHVLEVRQG